MPLQRKRSLHLFLAAFAALVAVLLPIRTAEASLVLQPDAVTCAPGGVIAFQVIGGTGDYQWSLAQNESGATVDAEGVYRAGMLPRVEDRIVVTDSLGDSATAIIYITDWDPLVVRQPTGTVPPRGTRQLEVTGGVPPYQYSYISNASGSVVSETGEYTAGPRGKVVDVVRVTDFVGQLAAAVVSVGPELAILPASPTVPPNATITFEVAGGDNAAVTWALLVNESGATIDPVSGVYRAGPTPDSTDTVTATDSLGNTAEVRVSVGGDLVVEPASARTHPRGTIQFQVQGGGQQLTWSMATSNSGGTIDPSTGRYVAGAIGSVRDEVRVTDDAGNEAIVSVQVGPALSILPGSATVTISGTVRLLVTGGSGEYIRIELELNASGAAIGTDFVYSAGEREGRDVVLVVDSAGNSARATIDVVATAPSLGPFDLSIGGGVGSGCGLADRGRGWAGAPLLCLLFVATAVRRSRRR